MSTRLPLLLAALLGLLCTISGGAEPTLIAQTDRADKGANPFTGRWIDVVATIDPKGARVPLEGLTVKAEAAGAEFGPAILPPPDGDGAYAAPFAVRIPMKPRVANEAVDVRVTASAKGFSATGSFETFAYAYPQPFDHAVVTAELKRSPAKAGEANAVLVSVDVHEGWHVYGSEEEVGTPALVELLPGGPKRMWSGGAAVEPKGKHVEGRVRVELPFTPVAAGKGVEARVAVYLSACTEEFCDPPEMVYASLGFDVEEGSGEPAGGGTKPDPGAKPPDSEAAPPSKGSTPAPLPAPSPGSREAGSTGLLGSLVKAFFAALLALVMPCTYPIIPITVSFFTKQAATGRSPVPLAAAYGAGIVAIFTAIGLLVGGVLVTGNQVLDFANLWWVNAIFALLFLAFGLSLVGLFEIRLPGFLNDVAARASGTGGYLSVFAMGATLVITSFTCTAPFIGNLLVDASRYGMATVTASMAVFGATMAAPFVSLSLSPQALQKLPRSGEWMNRLKVTLGILELGLVLKFVSQIDLAIGTWLIGRETFLVLWSVSFLAAALYLLGAPGWFVRRLRAPVGAVRGSIAAAFLAFTVYLLAGAGGRSLLGKLEAFFPSFEAVYARAFVAVAEEDYEAGVALAKARNAPIFLHFTGFQ